MHFNHFIQLISVSTKGELIEGAARIVGIQGTRNYDKVFSEYGIIGIVVIIIAIIYYICSSNRREKGEEEEKEHKRKEKLESNSIEGMNNLIKCNPCDVAAYKKRARLYNSQDQYEKSIEDYTKAIELNPSEPETYIDRGTIYGRAGKQKESIKDCTKALGLIDSDNIATGGNLLFLGRAYTCRSNAYRVLGDEEQYRKDRLKSKALDHPEDYYNEYAEIFIELGNLKRAMNECNKNVGLHPDDPRVYIDRARVYEELGKYEQAIFDLNEVVEVVPENGEAYYFRAIVYQKLDNKDNSDRDMVLAAKNGYKQAQGFSRKRH